MTAETDAVRALQYEGARYLFSRCLHSIVELGIAEQLGDSPETAESLAARAGLHPACPTNGKLLLLENLLPQETSQLTLLDRLNIDMDVAMLIFTGGRERKRSEYEVLLKSAGWHVNRAIETESGIAILEATRIVVE